MVLLIFLFLSCTEEDPLVIESTFEDSSTSMSSFPHPDQIDFDSYTGDMPDYYGEIVDVADGDTIYVDWFTEDRMGVRVKGIDTPETVDRRKPVQYWGPEASEFTKSRLTPGTIVRLDFEGEITGPFGRLLAYVWYWDGQEWIYWNREILETGNAFVYADYEFEYPNEFLEYQESAIVNERGMWANPDRIENDVVVTEEEFAEREYWYRRDHYNGE